MARAKQKKQTSSAITEKPKSNNGFTVFSIAYMLLFTVWPFIAVSSFPDQLLLPRLAAMCIFTGVIGIIIFVKRKEFFVSIPLVSPFIICFFAWVLITSLSFFWAANKAEAFQTIVGIWSVAAFATVTLWLYISNRLTFDAILNGISLMFAGFVLLGLMDVFDAVSAPGALDLNAITGHMGNKNELSAVLVFCLPFVLLKAYRSKVWLKYLLVLVAVLALFIIALLRSRGAWLALGLSGSVSLVVILLRSGRHFVKPALIGVMATIAIFIAAYFFVHRSEFNAVTRTETIDTRWQLWTTTVTMINDHPLQGVGAGNWKIQNPAYLLPKLDASKYHYKSLVLGEANFQQPHNDFLWVIAENGIPAGIFYTGIFITLLFYGIHLIRASEEGVLPENVALLAFLLSYIVIANVAFPLERPTHQLLLFVVAGLVMARYYAQSERKTAIVSPAILSILVTVVAIVCLYGINRWMNSEANMKDGLRFRGKQGYEKALGYYEATLSPYYNLDHASTPVQWYIGECYAVANDYNKALEAYQAAALANPYKIQNLANIGVAYYQLQKPDSALVYFKKAVAISPAFTEADINIAIYYMQQNKLDTALKYFLQSFPDDLDKRYQYFNRQLLGTYIEQLESTEQDGQKRLKLAALHNDTYKLLDIQSTSFYKKIPIKQVIYNNL